MTPSTTSKTKKGKSGKGRAAAGQLDDATRMAKALSHPLRHLILARLNERVASPTQLADELGERLTNVSYHVRALADLDCIELVETVPRRGALEHYYRATRRAMLNDAAWETLPASARSGFAQAWFRKTFADVAAAVEAGTFEAPDDVHLSFTPLVLDEQAWSELAGRLEEVLERALELQAEAAGRLQSGKSGGEEMSARLVLLQYLGSPERIAAPTLE